MQVGTSQDIYVPIAWEQSINGERSRMKRGDWWLRIMGRVKPGVTNEQARASIDAVFQQSMLEDERKKRGFPQILPVWLDTGPIPDGPLGALFRNLAVESRRLVEVAIRFLCLRQGKFRERSYLSATLSQSLQISLALGAVGDQLIRRDEVASLRAIGLTVLGSNFLKF